MIYTVPSLKLNLLSFWIYSISFWKFFSFDYLKHQPIASQIRLSFTKSLQSLAFPSWKSCSTLQISFSLLLLLHRPTTAVLQPTPLFCSINASPNSPPCSGSTVNLRIPFWFWVLIFEGFWWISFVLIWFYLYCCCCRAAQLRLCADGGANRVFDDLPLMFPHLDALDVRNRFGLLVSFSSVLL